MTVARRRRFLPQVTAELLFGKDSKALKEGRVATCQSLSVRLSPACSRGQKTNTPAAAFPPRPRLLLREARRTHTQRRRGGGARPQLAGKPKKQRKRSWPPLCMRLPRPAAAAALSSLPNAPQGTGSLRVGAAFCARFMKGRTVYISDPTWGNHKNIFGDEGVEASDCRASEAGRNILPSRKTHTKTAKAAPIPLISRHGAQTFSFFPSLILALSPPQWKTYRYFDPKTVGLDFPGLMADLTAAPDG